MRIDLSEVSALTASLLAAGPRTKRDVTEIVKTEAAKAERIMRANAPVRSGSLRDSIKTTPVRTSGGVVGAAVVAHAPHAPFVNYGTAHQAPQPFVPPAAEAVGKSFPAALEQAAADGLG